MQADLEVGRIGGMQMDIERIQVKRRLRQGLKREPARVLGLLSAICRQHKMHECLPKSKKDV